MPCAGHRWASQPGVLLQLAPRDWPTVDCQGRPHARHGQPALDVVQALQQPALQLRALLWQVILAADMSVASDDGATLFGKTDNPLNTAAGMAYEVVNNGYTLTLMNGDLAYAECAPVPCMCQKALCVCPICQKVLAMCWQLSGCVCAACAADTSVSNSHPAIALCFCPYLRGFRVTSSLTD